jgi:hypothetical protein
MRVAETEGGKRYASRLGLEERGFAGRRAGRPSRVGALGYETVAQNNEGEGGS